MRKVWVVGLLAAGLTGCGSDRVQPENIAVKQDTAMTRVKNLLESYANGQEIGSETTTYDALVSDLRKEDPAKADILKKGLDELQKTKGPATKTKAKDLLAKLGFSRAN